jgi:hypothetical protein
MSRSATKKPTEPSEVSLFASPPDEITAPPPAGKNAVAVRTPKASKPPAAPTSQQQVVPMTGIAEILGVFERLAVNKDVNPDSLDKLLAVQERLIDRNAELAFNQAFVEMTRQLPLIPKSGRIIVREKTASGKRDGDETQNTPYPKWEITGEKIKPVLHDNGFGLGHRIESVIESGERRVRVRAVLRHVGGHVDDSCYFDLPADTTGSKNNNQAWASSVTYAKRHTAFAVLGLVTEGDDDDAKSSGRAIVVGDPITPEDLDRLIEFARAAECPGAKLVAYLNEKKPPKHPAMTELAELPKSRFDEALAAIQSYESNKRARAANEAVKASAEKAKQ